MAFPAKTPLHNRAENSNSEPPPKSHSFVDALKHQINLTRRPTTRHSLLLPPFDGGSSLSSSSETSPVIIRTQIWRHALAPNTFFLDISKIPNLTDAQHFEQILMKCYKPEDFIGIKALGSRTTGRYVEINPHPHIMNKFTTEGVFYETQKIRLLPCKALEGEGNVVQINLINIPFLPHQEILEGLSNTFKKYGTVLDLGLKFDKTFKIFMGSGYAIIQQDANIRYPSLSHTVTFTGSSHFCYATFPDMPTWCRYCHEEGHTKYACAKSLASITCYACDKTGHHQADCPETVHRRKSDKPSYKKARKSPLLAASTTVPPPLTLESYLPSESVEQSKWASTESETIASTVKATPHSVTEVPAIPTASQHQVTGIASQSSDRLSPTATLQSTIADMDFSDNEHDEEYVLSDAPDSDDSMSDDNCSMSDVNDLAADSPTNGTVDINSNNNNDIVMSHELDSVTPSRALMEFPPITPRRPTEQGTSVSSSFPITLDPSITDSQSSRKRDV